MTNHNALVDAEGVPCANRGNALHDHTLKDVNSLFFQQKNATKKEPSNNHSVHTHFSFKKDFGGTVTIHFC